MKTETYTVIDYSELDELIKEHLGFEREWTDYSKTPYERHGNWEGVAAYLESGNDSNHIVDLRISYWTASKTSGPYVEGQQYESGWRDEIQKYDPEWGDKVSYYIAKLIEKGVIPEEHPIIIQVMW